MKKVLSKILFVVLVIGMAISAMLFCACNPDKKLQSVSVNIKSEYVDTNGEYNLGSFPFERYQVVLTYDDGTTSVRDLTEQDLAEAERQKLLVADSHEIVVSVSGFTCSFTCVGKLNNFEEVNLKNINAVYTGEDFEIEIEGTLPEGVKIEYPNGKCFKNVGHYEIEVKLSCDNYADKVLTGTVDITPATYDLSGFTFENDSVSYDGSQHTLRGSGKLPKGVSVAYYIGKIESEGVVPTLEAGSNAKEIGKYYVEARFTSSDENYYPIESIVRYLEITKIKFELSTIENDLNRQSSENIVYDGKDHRISISPTVIMPDKLDSDKMVIKYYKLNEDGSLTQMRKGEPVKNAGNYAIEITNLLVKEQYKEKYEPEKERIFVPFTVNKQVVDYSPFFADKTVTYNGKEQTMFFDDSNIPVLSTMRFLGIDYTLNGESVDKVINVGEYEVSLSFSRDDNFFIKPFSAKLTVEPFKYVPTSALAYATDYSESGIEVGTVAERFKSLFLSGAPSLVTEQFEGVELLTSLGEQCLRFIISGNYRLTANVSFTENIVADSCTFDFTVRKIDLPENIKNLITAPVSITYGEGMYMAILTHIAIVDDLCPGLDYTPCLTQNGVELDFNKVMSGTLIPDAGNYKFELKDLVTDNYFFNDAYFDITVEKAPFFDGMENDLDLGEVSVYYNENVVDYIKLRFNEIAEKDYGYVGTFTDDFVFQYKIVDEGGNERDLDEVLESGEYTVSVFGLDCVNYYSDVTYQIEVTVLPATGLPRVIQALFTKEFNLTTADNVEKIITEYVNGILQEHPDFVLNYSILKGENAVTDSDKVVYGENVFYKPGVYYCDFYYFSSENYKDISDVGALIVNVEKGDLPENLYNEMSQLINDGNMFVVTGSTTKEEEKEYFASAINVFNTFNTKYGGFANVGSLTFDTAEETGVTLTADIEIFPNGNKAIYFKDFTSEFFNIDLYAEWYVADKSDLPDEISELFVKEFNLNSSENLEKVIQDYISGITASHPDYVFTNVLYREFDLVSDSDKIIYNGNVYYKPGTYYSIFTDFSGDGFENIPYLGTITVNVSKAVMPLGLKLEMLTMLQDENTFTVTSATEEGAEKAFIQSAIDLYNEFNAEFEGILNIGSLTYDTETLQGIILSSSEDIPTGNKIIHFNNISSEFFDIDVSSTWYIADRINLPEEMKAIFTKEISITTSDSVAKAVEDFVSQVKFAHPDFEFSYTVYNGSLVEYSDRDIVTYGETSYNKAGIYTCVFGNFSSRNYSDVTYAGTLTINVNKTDLPNALISEMSEMLNNGKSLTFTINTLSQEKEFFNNALSLVNAFNGKYGAIVQIGSLTYDTATESGITVTEDLILPIGNKTINFAGFTSEVFNIDLAPSWSVVENVTLEDISALFTKEITLTTADDLEGAIADFKNGIISVHADFSANYVLYKDSVEFGNDDVVTYNEKTYYKVGTYTCVFTDFNCNYFTNVSEIGTLTVTVEKADLPSDLKEEMSLMLKDANSFEIRVDNADKEVEFFAQALDTFNAFNTKYSGLANIGSLTYVIGIEQPVALTEYPEALSEGNKVINFNDITSELFNMDLTSEWYVADWANLSDEIKTLFTNEITLKTTDDLEKYVSDYLDEIKVTHPDYQASFTIYNDKALVAESERITYNDSVFYKTGTYYCTFTEFSSENYKNIPYAGTFTITVEKTDLPALLKTEMEGMLKNGNALEIIGSTTQNDVKEFFASAFSTFNGFNTKYIGLANIGSLTYDTETESGISITENMAMLPLTDKTINFNDITSELFNIELTSTWSVTDKMTLNDIEALFTQEITLKSTDNLVQAVANFVADIKAVHPDYVFNSIIYKGSDELSDKDTVYFENTLYKAGVYTCKFKNFTNERFADVNDVGTLTVTVEKSDLPSDLKNAMKLLLEDGKTFEVKLATANKESNFFISALDCIESFNGKYGVIAKANSVIYDTTFTQNVVLTRDLKTLPIGNKTIYFNDITSEVYNIDFACTWNVIDRINLPGEVKAIFNKDITITSDEDIEGVIYNCVAEIMIAHPDFRFKYDLVNGNSQQFSENDYIYFNKIRYCKPGVYICEFTDFSSNQYEDVASAGTLIITVNKTTLPSGVKNEMEAILENGKALTVNGDTLASEKEFFNTAISAFNQFNAKYSGVASIGSLTYDTVDANGIALTSADNLPIGNKTIHFNNITSTLFNIDLTSTWQVTDKAHLSSEDTALFNKTVSLNTTDNVEQYVQNYVQDIKSAHKDFVFNYSLTKDSHAVSDSDKIMFTYTEERLYYKAGTYVCTFSDLSGNNYKNIAYAGTLTINVNKVDLPSEYKDLFVSTLNDGASVTITGETLKNEKDFYTNAISNFNILNQTFSGLVNIGSLTLDTDNEKGINLLTMVNIPIGNKTITFGNFTSDFFNIDLSATWHVLDKGHLPSEISALFNGSITITSADDLVVEVAKYANGIKEKYPDFDFTSTIYHSSKLFNAEKDTFTFGEEKFYRSGSYDVKFTNLVSDFYIGITDIGTLTVSVTLANPTQSLQAKIDEIILDQRTLNYPIWNNSKEECQNTVKTAYQTFNSTFEGFIRISDVLFDSRDTTGVVMSFIKTGYSFDPLRPTYVEFVDIKSDFIKLDSLKWYIKIRV